MLNELQYSIMWENAFYCKLCDVSYSNEMILNLNLKPEPMMT